MSGQKAEPNLGKEGPDLWMNMRVKRASEAELSPSKKPMLNLLSTLGSCSGVRLKKVNRVEALARGVRDSF
jgi:hypothetical protein